LVVRKAVMNAHPLSANATYDAALQKRRAFACRSGFPHSAKSQRVFGEALLIGLKLFPADVAGMSPGNHECHSDRETFVVLCLPSGKRRVRTRP